MILGWLLGALWLGVLWVWLGLHPGLHADATYLYDLLQSLQAGGRLGTWDLPPSPSLWPDLGILAACKVLGHDLLTTQRLFGLAMGLWFWSSLTKLMRRLLELPKAGARAWAAAGLLTGLLLTPPDSGLMDWALPGHHGAAYCLALGLWAWVLKQRERPSGLIASSFKGVGLGLYAASDALLWPWGFVPGVLLAMRLRGPGLMRLAWMTALAALSAWAFHAWLAHTGARLAVLRWAFVFQRSAADWHSIAALTPAYLRSLGAVPALTATALLLWAWPREGRGSAPRVMLLGWALAAVACVFVGTMVGAYSGRYLYIALSLPLALLPLLLAERWPALEGPGLLTPALAALLWLAAPAHRSLPGPAPLQAQAQALDLALKSRGLQYGWADYWMARPMRLLSAQGTVAVPMLTVNGALEPYAWIGDRNLLAQGAALERPQFVLLNGLDEAAVRARLGVPKERMEFEGLTLFIPGPAKPQAGAKR